VSAGVDGGGQEVSRREVRRGGEVSAVGGDQSGEAGEDPESVTGVAIINR